MSAPYGRFSSQAASPWVAAYSLRSALFRVRPATITVGRPGAPWVQVVEPAASASTPKSVAT